LLQVQRNHLGLVDYLQQLAVSANGGALVRERKLAFELLIKESDVEVCAEVWSTHAPSGSLASH
jgi:hypothetical protein